jgi:hypothetical protein
VRMLRRRFDHARRQKALDRLLRDLRVEKS